eukprot:10881508-Karenia_brevis.AAC.1
MKVLVLLMLATGASAVSVSAALDCADEPSMPAGMLDFGVFAEVVCPPIGYGYGFYPYGEALNPGPTARSDRAGRE